jgi:hypothetical protein
MPQLQTLDCFQPGIAGLERVKYFNRMLLTAEDMRTDQDFVLQKLRRHNRFLHGWGVACGLIVKAAPTTALPWRVQIGQGYALGPYGDEIFVGQEVFLDLAKCGPGSVTNPCEPSFLVTSNAAAGGQVVYVAIKYAECRARPVRSMPGGCGCDDDACEYSRIRDSFSVECLANLPPSHQPDPDAPTLCDLASGRRLLECLPCPTDPWVVLAKVALPASGNTAVADTGIDNAPPIRRLVFSTAVIQQQVIECCCGDDGHEPPPPPKPTRLEIVKKGSNVQVVETPAGGVVGVVKFQLKVANLGPEKATNVIVKDNIGGIDPGLIVSVSDLLVQPAGQGSWTGTTPPSLMATLGQLDAGTSASLSFTMTFRIREAPQDAKIRNVATLSSDTPTTPDSIVKTEFDVPVNA